MIARLQFLKDARVLRWPALLLAAYAAVSLWIFGNGFIKPLSLPVLLGAMALVFSIKPAPPRSGRAFQYLTIGILFLTVLVPVRTLLFFALGSALFSVLTQLGYGCRLLSVACWLFISPVFSYAANIFSLPIRMKLATGAGRLLQLLNDPVAVRGNVIERGAGRFSIDPGCMGLNMLVASLLLGIILVGYYEHRKGCHIGNGYLLFFLLSVVLFNVFSNLVRILLLVWFNWLPGTAMHDAAGILCMALYVGLPATVLARFLVSKGSQEAAQEEGVRSRPGPSAILLVLFVASAIHVSLADRSLHLPAKTEAAGYIVTEFGAGVLKLQDAHHLAYLKFVHGWYDAEHNPTICWEGSGYKLSDISEQSIAGVRLYTAVLTQGRERLHTAWWYSDGRLHSNRQLAWRWAALRSGKRFALVNITAATAAERDREVARVIRESAFSPLFHLIGQQP
jgi:exosortase N